MRLMNCLAIAILRLMAFGMFPRRPVKELVMVDVPQRSLAASLPAMYLVERYIERQLYAFRSGECCNDEGKQRQVIPRNLRIRKSAISLSSCHQEGNSGCGERRGRRCG
jgi:hypothetical protein